MHIVETSVCQSAVRTYTERQEERTALTIMTGSSSPTDAVSISDEARSELETQGLRDELDQCASAGGEFLLKKLLVEILSGREVRLTCIEPEGGEAAEGEQSLEGDDPTGATGWAIRLEQQSLRQESEQVDYRAQGLVQTADGRQVSFTLGLSMRREYLEEHHLTLQAGDPALIDPLVINFDGRAAQLTDMTFRFDLDADGSEESLSLPSAGRGFLALDRNGDGLITDGMELFGPDTGDGFAELAAFDTDHNRWIDEHDAVFERLSVMTPDAQGGQTLATLKDCGIGAIYLDPLETPFELHGPANELQGRVRASGVFLKEDGTPGSLQQLDLVG